MSSAQRAPRIQGIDVTRGLAIAGMLAGHVGDDGSRGAEGGWSWLWIVPGRSSAIFAIIVGMSITLMLAKRATSAGTTDGADAAPRHTRVRVWVRAALVILIGLGLAQLHTPVAIVLVNFGIMFALVTFVLQWRTRTLLIASAAFALVGPLLYHALRNWTFGTVWHDMPVVSSLWSAFYPIIVWMAYMTLGVVLARLPLKSATTQLELFGYGTFAMAAGYLGGPALGGATVNPDAPHYEQWWASAAPHSYSSFEVVGNMGFTLVILAVMSYVSGRWPRSVSWLIPAGSMTLTLYVGHVLAIAIIGPEVVYQPSNVSMVAFVSIGITFAWLWTKFLGTGPLERVLSTTSSAIADRLERK